MLFLSPPYGTLGRMLARRALREVFWCGGHRAILEALVITSALLTACGEGVEPSLRGPSAVAGLAASSDHFRPALGKGVNASETRTFATCVSFPPPSRNPGTFERRAYDEFSISSRSELNEKMEITASVAAKALWGTGAAHASYFRGVEINETSFYWVVSARYEMLHESLATESAEFALSPHAARLLAEHGWQAFQAACGTHFFAGQRLGAQYALLYEFTARDDKVNNKIAADAKAGAFGISLAASFSSALTVANSGQSLRIHSDIIGGDHRVADFAESPERLRQELAHLREAVGLHHRGVPLGWEILEYDIFPEVVAAKLDAPPPEIEVVAVDDALAGLYGRFNDNQRKLRRLRRSFRDSQGDEPLFIFSDAQVREMEANSTALTSQNLTISRRAQACIAEPSPAHCTMADLDLMPAHIPEPVWDLSGLGDRNIFLAPAPGATGEMQAFLDIYEFGPAGAKTCGLHRYRTGGAVMQGADAYIYAFAGSGRVPQRIGRLRYEKSEGGAQQPDLCRGLFADVCQLRLVRRPGCRFDGSDKADLLLSVYDEKGEMTAKMLFHAHYEPTILRR